MMLHGAMLTLAILPLGMGLAGCGGPERRLTDNSDLIFSGTMVLPRASTIEADEVADLAIVRVDEILSGSEAYARFAGKPITVRLATPDRAKVGDRMVYFTKGWHYGDELGVIEVGAVATPSGGGLQSMKDDIARFQQEKSDSVLRALLASADLVVTGRVSAVRQSDIPRLPTEHDPDWQEASIAVTAVLKGAAGTKEVVVLFPGTDDPMWVSAPRFPAGTEGIWILRQQDLAGVKLPHLTAAAPGQFRPLSDAERITRLLR